MANNIIYGQAWFINSDDKKKLVQDLILILNGNEGHNTVVLVEDVMKDLKDPNGKCKSNQKKNYFYYEYTRTNLDGENMTVQIEAPHPEFNDFGSYPPYDLSQAKSDWAKYWMAKLQTTYNNFNEISSIQPKEIIFHGSEYVDPATGEVVKVEETRVVNNDLGDITSLLSMY